MNKKMIAIRVTEEQKKQIEDKAGDKSITQYLIDSALADFARESVPAEDGAEWMPVIVTKHGSLDAFVEKLVKRVGVADVLKLMKWVEEGSNPFSGYVVVDISSNGVTVSKGGKQVAISEELGNGGMLTWFFTEDGVPLYNVGSLI